MGVGPRAYISEVWRVGLEVYRPLNVILAVVNAIILVVAGWGVIPLPPAVLSTALLIVWVFLIMAPYHVWKRFQRICPFGVSVPGDEKSRFPTMSTDRNVRYYTLRLFIENKSAAQITDFGAIIKDIIPIEPGVQRPVLGHEIRLPCAMLDQEPYEPKTIKIGSSVPVGVCVSNRESNCFNIMAMRLPTTFDGRLALGVFYDIVIIVSCSIAAMQVIVRTKVNAGEWDNPSFQLISADPLLLPASHKTAI
jgi:hypothetical protein